MSHSPSILITGAYGQVGSALIKHIEKYNKDYNLRLADIKKPQGQGIDLDITNIESCKKACDQIDVLIHLAGNPYPDSSFDEVLHPNIIGTYNMFQAAAETGVKRIVYASSAQVIEGYPHDEQIKTNMPVRPKNLYGVSKAYGEALSAYFAFQMNIEVIAVRIGAFEYQNNWSQMSSRDLSAWSEPDDISSLFILCIEAEMADSPFMIAHGISNNRFKRLDLSDTKQILGYSPKMDSFSVWNYNFSEVSKRNKTEL